MNRRPISALAELNPPLRRALHDEHQVSFVSMADVDASGGIRSSRSVPFGTVKAGFTRFQDGDVLFAKITPCMENGKGALAAGLEGGVGCGSTEFHVLRAIGENSSAYIYQLLQWNSTRQSAEVLMSGSAGQKRVPTDFFRRHEVYAPEPGVQQRIAAVLAALDNAIAATEALIEKHQQIKAGLMHDLFTRGVLSDGSLRPSRRDAPDQYQLTKAGWIPIDWSLTTCEAVCGRVIDCKNRTPPETHEGAPVIRTPNVRHGEFVDDELVYTDPHSYAIWTSRGKPEVGDVVITREAPVGEVCMIPERHQHACLGQRTMLYRPSETLIDPRFFLFALQSSQIQSRLDLISGGSTVGHVRVGDIRTLWMFQPKSMREQVCIAESLIRATQRLTSERALRDKLRRQKLGLMQDLLTGKVRVKLPEPANLD